MSNYRKRFGDLDDESQAKNTPQDQCKYRSTELKITLKITNQIIQVHNESPKVSKNTKREEKRGEKCYLWHWKIHAQMSGLSRHQSSGTVFAARFQQKTYIIPEYVALLSIFETDIHPVSNSSSLPLKVDHQSRALNSDILDSLWFSWFPSNLSRFLRALPSP